MGPDQAKAIKVDKSGNIFVSGMCVGSFPGTNGEIVPRDYNIFFSKFSPAGKLIFTTIIGGDGLERINDMALDDKANAVVTGLTFSYNFPTTKTAMDRTCGTDGKCNRTSRTVFADAFVAKVRSDGQLMFSSFFGGRYDDGGHAVATDHAGNIYFSGTSGGGIPIKNPIFSGSRGGYIAKLGQGGKLVYSSYLYPGGVVDPESLATDASGNLYIAGTASADIPLVQPIQTQRSGLVDAFVLSLTPNGRTLTFSTYLGGEGVELYVDLAAKPDGTVTVVGITDSRSFPVLNAVQPDYGGGLNDTFISQISRSRELSFSSYFGGSKGEIVPAVCMDPRGNIYVSMKTRSKDLPLVNALQGFNAGATSSNSDAYFLKMDPAGTKILYGTYFGGRSEDGAYDIHAGANGSTYACGYTFSKNLMLKNPIQSRIGGSSDAYIVKILPSPAPSISFP